MDLHSILYVYLRTILYSAAHNMLSNSTYLRIYIVFYISKHPIKKLNEVKKCPIILKKI
jgi:hypothetical protein